MYDIEKIYQFNEDGTFTIKKTYNNEVTNGTYEVLQDTRDVLLFENEGEEEHRLDIISIDKYMIRLGATQIYYMYRPEAFIFDKTEIYAPQEGGTFTIQVKKQFPLRLSNKESVSSNITNIYQSIHSTIQYTSTITDNAITVTIAPNTSNLNLTTNFNVEDTYGNCIATITINQEKNAETIKEDVSLSEWGKNECYSILSNLGNVLRSFEMIDRDYILGTNSNFKPVLSMNNSILSEVWSYAYSTINHINKLINLAEQELSNGPLKTPLETLRAILYYNLAVFWGNVPYVTEENINDLSPKQLTTTQLFEKLIPQLKNAIEILEERKAPTSNSDIDNYIYLSKDIARIALAQIYMYQGEYKEAEILFVKMKDNGFNGYRELYDILYISEYGSLYGYTDLLLGLSECKIYGSTPDDADTFINEILSANSIKVESTDKVQKLNEIYEGLINFTPFDQLLGYFAFLKRNGLAKETIGLTDDYQLLFPIPQSELNQNPNMKQNPGY